jgi:hypothetical protein
MNKINGFDIDGVITVGIYPGKNDIIISGRSFEEYPETISMLEKKGIFNRVYFNKLPFKKKTRQSSGFHKADTLNSLKEKGIIIDTFFEDDEIQYDVIKENCPWIKLVHVSHNLTEKENIRHLESENE